METFATINDLQDRWKLLEPDQITKASVRIFDASAMITRMLSKSGVKITKDEVQVANLRYVTCAVVQRSLASENAVPYTQMTESVGDYSNSYTLPGANGDMYLTSAEKKMLGIGGFSTGSIRPRIGVLDDTW